MEWDKTTKTKGAQPPTKSKHNKLPKRRRRCSGIFSFLSPGRGAKAKPNSSKVALAGVAKEYAVRENIVGF